jgi:hypothetical protein
MLKVSKEIKRIHGRFPLAVINSAYYHRALGVVVCLIGKSKYISPYKPNIYVFRSNALGHYEIHSKFDIKNVDTILGEFEEEIVFGIKGNHHLAVGKIGKIRRRIQIRFIKFNITLNVQSFLRPLEFSKVTNVFWHFSAVITKVLVFFRTQVLLKTFFTIYELKGTAFVVHAKLIKTLDYKATALFAIIKHQTVQKKRYRYVLLNDGRVALESYWDDLANFYIIDMSRLYKERLAISVYKKDLDFSQVEQRVLTGLVQAGIPVNEMLHHLQISMKDTRTYVQMLDNTTLYIEWGAGWADERMDYSRRSTRLNMIVGLLKPCGILPNISWPMEAKTNGNVFHYFVDNKKRLVAWPCIRQRNQFQAEVFTIKP